MYRKVDEAVKALADRSYAEAVMARVDKGSKGSFSYVPWNETAKLLDRVFGPFGWTARITDRQITTDGTNYVYSVGLDLQVFVEGEDGHTHTVSRPGVGVGIASPNRNSVLTADAHDTAAKGARSDALSTAAKMLGDAFGLYLYDRGDPARTEPTTNNTAPARQEAPTNNESKDLGFRPSENQLKFARSLGWSDADFARMPFKQWKGILDSKQRKPDANKATPVKSQDALVEELFG